MDRHFMISRWCFGLTFLSLYLMNPAAAQVDQQLADTYFKEAAAICTRDGGRLWGVSLCGPMVFADARTRTLATNQPRPGSEQPRSLGFANAPLEWGGSRWAAYMWDFTTSLPDARTRDMLMLHELFHRVQPELGLITDTGQNAHVDTVDGRVWLRLEWRALSRALNQHGDESKRAVSEAVAFRLIRRSQFANAAENERVEEIREGLAQYTGTVVTASSQEEAAANAVEQLAAAEQQETLLQQVYVAGVAYGILLDAASSDWRRTVRGNSDLGEMLIAALNITPAADAAEAATHYGSAELRAEEEMRAERRRALVSELQNRFVEGPVLLVPSGGGGTFNAQGATPIPGAGTVYVLPYRMSGQWGSMEAMNGVMISSDGMRHVPGPVHIDGSRITGKDWTVTVASGWTVQEGPRAGDYQIVRAKQ